MKRTPLLLLSLLLFFGGSCAYEARAQEPYRWAKVREWPDCEALYLNGQLIGGWNYAEWKYFPWVGNGWGPATSPPTRPPVRNFGLGLEGVRRDACFSERERVTLNGQEVTLAEGQRRLVEASGAGTIPDDRGKPFAVVVGTEDQCQRARAALAKAEATTALRVQYYRPDDAMIRDRDGKVMYAAGVTLVSAAGVVAGHSDKFDAADELAEGLRKLDPKTDPQKFPSLKDRAINSAIGAMVPHLATIAGGMVLLSVGGLVYLGRRKR